MPLDLPESADAIDAFLTMHRLGLLSETESLLLAALHDDDVTDDDE